jgi:hypothetical protein
MSRDAETAGSAGSAGCRCGDSDMVTLIRIRGNDG